MTDVAQLVDKAIANLSEDFLANPNKYLTEEDMRVHLCIRLMSDFGEIEETADGDTSIALHSEVRWWGAERRTDRADIVILDVRSINVTADMVNREQELRLIPRKGYSASKPLAAIELKFRRPSGPSDNEYLHLIKNDIQKIREIQGTIAANLEHLLVCRIVAFDKKSHIHNIEDHFTEEFVTYKFANKKQH